MNLEPPIRPRDRVARGGTLILGGGFAGSYVARGLASAGATLINPTNFMLYTPLLPEAAAGTIEPRRVTVPIRAMCPRADLLLGRAVGLDHQRRRVHVESDAGTFTVTYADLVIALGSVSSMPPVPGLREHALALKDVADAIRLRNHVLRQIELADAAPDSAARRLTFVFAGAGFAGVETLAELQELAAGALRRHPRLRGMRAALGARRRGCPHPRPAARAASPASPPARSRAWHGDPHRDVARARRRGAAPCSPTAAGSRRRRSSGPPASRRARCSPSSGYRSTRAAACGSRRRCRCTGCRASGRSATAQPSPTRRRRRDRPRDLPARAAPGAPARAQPARNVAALPLPHARPDGHARAPPRHRRRRRPAGPRPARLAHRPRLPPRSRCPSSPAARG